MYVHIAQNVTVCIDITATDINPRPMCAWVTVVVVCVSVCVSTLAASVFTPSTNGLFLSGFI